MHQMFMYCSSLTSLDVSNFENSSVTDMESMFDDDFDGEDALSEEDEDKEGDANLFDDWIDDGEEEEADTDLFGGDDDDNDENDEFALFEE